MNGTKPSIPSSIGHGASTTVTEGLNPNLYARIEPWPVYELDPDKLQTFNDLKAAVLAFGMTLTTRDINRPEHDALRPWVRRRGTTQERADG